jgi:hypothetical protein
VFSDWKKNQKIYLWQLVILGRNIVFLDCNDVLANSFIHYVKSLVCSEQNNY